MDAEFCTSCGEKGAEKRCSACKMVSDFHYFSLLKPGIFGKPFATFWLQVIYCEKACQKLHWFTHKKVCKKLQEQREKQEAESTKLRMQQSQGALSSQNKAKKINK